MLTPWFPKHCPGCGAYDIKTRLLINVDENHGLTKSEAGKTQ